MFNCLETMEMLASQGRPARQPEKLEFSVLYHEKR